MSNSLLGRYILSVDFAFCGNDASRLVAYFLTPEALFSIMMRPGNKRCDEEDVQPIIAALPKEKEGSAAPKISLFGLLSILYDDFLTSWRPQ